MNQTRKIVEGASLLAIFIIVLLIFFYVPILGMFAMFTLSVPFILYTSRFGLKSSWLFLVGALLLTLIFGGVVALPVTVMFGTSGMVIGYFIKKESEAFSVFISGSLAFILNFVLIYVLSAAIFGVNFSDAINEIIDGSMAMIENLTPMSENMKQQQLEILNGMAEMLLLSIPSAITLSGITFALLSILIANLILKRRKSKYVVFPPFKDWNFPVSLLWYYLIANLLLMFGIESDSFLYIMIINVWFILEVVMTVQGLSFIFYYFNVKGLHKGILITVLVVIFIIPLLLNLVRILGIIDLGFKLKRRIVKKDHTK